MRFDSEELTEAVSAYVAERLNREAIAYGRGFATAVATATGVSVVHISNVRNRKCGVGVRFASALERYWGLERNELESLARRGR